MWLFFDFFVTNILFSLLLLLLLAGIAARVDAGGNQEQAERHQGRAGEAEQQHDDAALQE